MKFIVMHKHDKNTEAGTLPGFGFHQNLMAAPNQLIRSGWRQSDPILLILNLTRNTYYHGLKDADRIPERVLAIAGILKR